MEDAIVSKSLHLSIHFPIGLLSVLFIAAIALVAYGVVRFALNQKELHDRELFGGPERKPTETKEPWELNESHRCKPDQHRDWKDRDPWDS